MTQRYRRQRHIAQSARTDLEKRNRLRNYYDVYYQRMSALATTPGTQVGIAVVKDVSSGYAGSATRAAYSGYLYALANPVEHTCAKKKPADKQKKKKERHRKRF